MLNLINIIMLILMFVFNLNSNLHEVSVGFSLQGSKLELTLDPVFVCYVDNLDWLSQLAGRNIGGFAIGDLVVIKKTYKNYPFLLQHELNHVKQYQALGDYFQIAGMLGLNLEGYPYYPDGDIRKINATMWKPPDWWPFHWHLIDLEFQIAQ